jgi:hypothetical protein
MAGKRTRHGTWRRDRHGRAPARTIKVACVVPDVRAGFGTARPNRACDDIKGPLTEPQTDVLRRTILGARNGLQWAAHLDLLSILILGRLDQLH